MFAKLRTKVDLKSRFLKFKAALVSKYRKKNEQVAVEATNMVVVVDSQENSEVQNTTEENNISSL